MKRMARPRQLAIPHDKIAGIQGLAPGPVPSVDKSFFVSGGFSRFGSRRFGFVVLGLARRVLSGSAAAIAVSRRRSAV
jgi:hypothetical protein